MSIPDSDSDRVNQNEVSSTKDENNVPSFTNKHDKENSKIETAEEKCKKYCKKFLAFLLSHVGICALVIAYAILGGFLFQHLEGRTEVDQRKIALEIKADAIGKLWTITAIGRINRNNWTVIAEALLEEYQNGLVELIKAEGWDGKDDDNKGTKWSYPGSLLYCITVVTTIGYGHITPRTRAGRIATMLYAMPGIPLTLLCLSILGSTWAQCFRYCYYHACQLLSGKGKVEIYISSTEDVPTSLKQRREAEKERWLKVRVPLYVSILVIISYIAGGSLLFSIWEEDWDFLTASYFSFVTLSTIGFGDYVFGIGHDLDNNIKLITSAVYLVMGLSIIAMCFSLMQEEVAYKFRALGKYVGIIGRTDNKSEVS